jgi:hypothetical protein
MKNNVRDVLVIFEVEADLNLILEVKLVDESMWDLPPNPNYLPIICAKKFYIGLVNELKLGTFDTSTSSNKVTREQMIIFRAL